jgi:hypothetical protein
VVLLNEIPTTNTATTCEGHYPYLSGWPSKDGWIWFESRDNGLVELIEKFCKSYDFTELKDCRNQNCLYCIEAHFPQHPKNPGELTSDNLTFKTAAEERKKKMDVFWEELTGEVEKYASKLQPSLNPQQPRHS